MAQITESQLDIIAESIEIISAVSAVASLTNVILNLRSKNTNDLIVKLSIGISCMDLVFSISTALNTNWGRYLCRFIFLLRKFGFLGSIAFVSCLAHWRYKHPRSPEAQISRKEFRRYFFYSLFLPVFLSVLSSKFTSSFKSSCWDPKFDYETSSLYWFDGPWCIALGLTTILYMSTIRKLRKLEKKWHWELLMYSLVLLFVGCPMFVTHAFIGTTTNMGWYIFTNGSLSLMGLMNSFVYGLGKRIRQALKRRSSDEDEEDDEDEDYGFLQQNNNAAAEGEQQQQQPNASL